MTIQETKTITLETTDCCSCGITFAVPKRLLDQRRQDLDSFYCPNGHSMVFRKSTADILKQDIERIKREKEEAERARYALHNELTEKQEEVRKLKKSIERRNKRIAAGVCPCCNRTFKQLAAHIKTKHPELASQ